MTLEYGKVEVIEMLNLMLWAMWTQVCAYVLYTYELARYVLSHEDVERSKGLCQGCMGFAKCYLYGLLRYMQAICLVGHELYPDCASHESNKA